MSLILCVETTSTNCSVALATENAGLENNLGIQHCLDLLEDNDEGYSHGEKLHVFIDEILRRNNLTVNDLSAIAVSEGPGSYTGLRIGVATVKGLCFALGIPMIAISTLEALSKQDPSDRLKIAFLDARRMEVYAAVFQNSLLIQEPRAVILDESSFSKFRAVASHLGPKDQKVTFIGTGVKKFEELIKEGRHFYMTSNPTALTLCDLAVSKYKKSDTVDVAYFEPFYLKEFKTG